MTPRCTFQRRTTCAMVSGAHRRSPKQCILIRIMSATAPNGARFRLNVIMLYSGFQRRGLRGNKDTGQLWFTIGLILTVSQKLALTVG